jgi:hypothetical protein
MINENSYQVFVLQGDELHAEFFFQKKKKLAIGFFFLKWPQKIVFWVFSIHHDLKIFYELKLNSQNI